MPACRRRAVRKASQLCRPAIAADKRDGVPDNVLQRQPARPFQGTSPHREHTPAGIVKLGNHVLIPSPVFPDFGTPELLPRRRHPEQRAIVTVPEASVHQNDGAMAREDQIGTTRQIPRMQPVAQTFRVQRPSENELRTGVPGPYTAHVQPALLRRENIHLSKPAQSRPPG